jgi:hypothetical protein
VDHRTEFVPSPRRASGRSPEWAQPEGPAQAPAVPGLRGTPPPAPASEPKQQVGPTHAEIDGEALARDVNARIEALASEGYSVVSVVPITSGAYGFERDYRRHFETWFSAGAAYGYGYSYTEGLLIVAARS